jgi:hypothetical protein
MAVPLQSGSKIRTVPEPCLVFKAETGTNGHRREVLIGCYFVPPKGCYQPDYERSRITMQQTIFGMTFQLNL